MEVVTKVVECGPLRSVLVRRLRRSERNSAMAAAGMNPENIGSVLKYQEYLTRMVIVEAKVGVEFRTVTEAGLKMASAEVYDAIPDAALREIAEFSFANAIPEILKGN